MIQNAERALRTDRQNGAWDAPCIETIQSIIMTDRKPEAPMLLSLPGAPALSPFRRDKLFVEMKGRVPALARATAVYCHFAALDGVLDARETAVLERLLTYGPKAESEAGAAGELMLVIP